MILWFLFFLTILSSFMKYSNVFASDLSSPLLHPQNGSIFPKEKLHCQTKNDCTKLIAYSFCSFKKCRCIFGYKFHSMACLKLCQVNDDCLYDDPNRKCKNGLCQCKEGYKEEPKNKFCIQESVRKLSSLGLILVCLLAGISPLTIVMIAVCCKTINSGSLTNRTSNSNETQTNNNQSDNQRNNQSDNHSQNLNINPPPSYSEIESIPPSPPPSYEEAVSSNSHKT